MTTDVIKSFGSLQEELEIAKGNLKNVDEHIRRLIGRDPTDGPPRSGFKRQNNPVEDFRGRGKGFTPLRGRREPGGRGAGGRGAGEEEEESPLTKRRPGPAKTVFSRLSGPPKKEDSGDEDDTPEKQPTLSSRVFATPKQLPSRKDALAAQGSDEISRARNRRMFGALMGTLQKFRQEETRMKTREEKRLKVEKKLEENAIREKEELKRETMELFEDRKRKQAEIRKIELKMIRIREQDEWEALNKNLLNFIQTRTKPPIFYMPKIPNAKTDERLAWSQRIVTNMFDKKRLEVQQELEAIEKRGYWQQSFSRMGGNGLEELEEEEESEEENLPTIGSTIVMKPPEDKENRRQERVRNNIESRKRRPSKELDSGKVIKKEKWSNVPSNEAKKSHSVVVKVKSESNKSSETSDKRERTNKSGNKESKDLKPIETEKESKNDLEKVESVVNEEKSVADSKPDGEVNRKEDIVNNEIDENLNITPVTNMNVDDMAMIPIPDS